MDYIIRNIDEALWRRAKHLAIDERVPVRALVIRALKELVEKLEAEYRDKEVG